MTSKKIGTKQGTFNFRRITKHMGNWVVSDNTVKISNRVVYNAMNGSYITSNRSLGYGHSNRTAKPTTNSYSYSPKYTWYSTDHGGFMAGGWAKVTLKRGKSKWNLTVTY